jgi:hypothetical protein
MIGDLQVQEERAKRGEKRGAYWSVLAIGTREYWSKRLEEP